MSRRSRSRHNRPKEKTSKIDFEPNWNEAVLKFEDMNLKPELIQGILNFGFENPTDIQSVAIKPIIEHRNVVAQAQPRCGKKGAFEIGILNNLDLSNNTTQALILVPVREIALKIQDCMTKIGTGMPNLSVISFIGGTPIAENGNEAQKQPHVAVCTPGRCLALIQSHSLNLHDLKMICIDDANVLLSIDFIGTCNEIFKNIPSGIQTLLFSYIIDESVSDFISKSVNDPVKISVKTEESPIQSINHFYVLIDQQNKISKLNELINSLPIQKAVIYINSGKTIESLKNKMNVNFPVSFLNNKMNQINREENIRNFVEGDSKIIIGTSLISDCIDSRLYNLIFNFGLPAKAEEFGHRLIFGPKSKDKKGIVAVNIIDVSERKNLNYITKTFNLKIEQLPDDFASYVADANRQFYNDDE